MNASAAPFTAAVLLASPVASANTAAPEIATGGGLLQATLGLALVLGLIVGVAWIAKRLAPGAVRGGVSLPVIASQAVGQCERVVVIEVADQWLVLGVAPGHVTGLATLPKGTLPASTPAAANFASVLSRTLGRRH